MADLVWVLLQHVLLSTDLLFNRHLDTMVLCCVYAVCTKVAKTNLKFKKIISVYNLTRADANAAVVVRAVHRAQNLLRYNIIDFYNKDFIQEVKVFINERMIPLYDYQQRHGHHAPHQSLAPPLAPRPSRPAVSPRTVAAHSNVYVSPLKRPKNATDTLLHSACNPSVPGVQVYAFGSSPRKQLSSMNSMINGPQTHSLFSHMVGRSAGRGLFGTSGSSGGGAGLEGSDGFVESEDSANPEDDSAGTGNISESSSVASSPHPSPALPGRVGRSPQLASATEGTVVDGASALEDLQNLQSSSTRKRKTTKKGQATKAKRSL